MKIFLLNIHSHKLISIKSLNKLFLKQDEILLLFGGNEMLKKYKYENLLKEDKHRIDSNPNLANKNEFKISRGLIFEFEKNYKDSKNFYKSISHSANYALIAISLKKVGIDLELVKKRDFAPHLDFCFSDYQKYKVSNSKNPLIEFYKIWTTKEATIKLLNLGFYALDKIDKIDKIQENNISHFSKSLKIENIKFIYSIAYYKQSIK